MSNTINLVLFGTIGKGKSSTGNSILGRDAFELHHTYGSTTELQSTVLKDGRVLNVIDTPGLHQRSFEAVYSTDIVRCANLAKDGIHAILMVFSSGSRPSPNDDAAIKILKTCFGENILNYVVVVLTVTDGDFLERRGVSFEQFISRNVNHTIQEFINSCNGRIVLFDNGTCNKDRRARQLERLMHLVDTVIASNCGKPFSDENFHKLKNWKGFSERQMTSRGSFAFQKIVQNVQELDKRLAKVQAALSFVEVSEEGNIEDEEDIRKLKESLERVRRDFKVFLKHGTSSGRIFRVPFL